MPRSERLIELIQALRRRRQPATGRALADELGVSLRTLYRDIASLQGQGADIIGEAGVGYVLKPGFLLPPLMFSEDEIEALVLGSRWVIERADGRLGGAARNALAKIAAVLPEDLRDTLDASPLLIGPGGDAAEDAVDLSVLRQAIRAERKVAIRYRDAGGAASERIVWPFALGFFDHARVMVAWCELRSDFRNFRTDRLEAFVATGERYPRRRRALLHAWREVEGIPLES
ncbi:MAG TPA: YafY family protein [Roseiarcus sp.]|jgi:predicted DNA-binding transcriptional regulator YafY